MDQGESRHRLPHRSRSPLLQRAALAGGRARHGTRDRLNGRMLLQGRARRGARAQLPERQAHDATGTHAQRTPQAHEVDTGATAQLGPEHRHRHARRRAVAAGEPSASRAGLSSVLGPAQSLEDLRRATPGGGVLPSARHRLADASAHHRDPQSQVGPASRSDTCSRHGGCNGLAYAQQRALRRLLPCPIDE